MSILKATLRVAGRAGMATLKGTGTVLNGTAKLVRRHEDSIAQGTRVLTSAAGEVVKFGGRAIASGAGVARDAAIGAAQRSESNVGKAFGYAAGYAAAGAALLGRGVQTTGELAQKAAPATGGMVGGVLSGTTDAVSGAVDAVAVTQHDIERTRAELRRYGERIRQQSERRLAAIRAAQRDRRQSDLLDLLVIGGTTLSEAIRDPQQVPPAVIDAFQKAYPDLAARESFSEVVQRLSPEELAGFTNGVKGKLFEIELVEHMNAGGLPNGWHAELAPSATQRGWDIRVSDDDGRLVEVLQAKATESAAYVKEAIERYPDIDVTTTSEVHAQLVAVGLAENVRDGGISESALQAKLEAAIQDGGSLDAGDFVPSVVGLAVIALSAFTDRNLSLQQRGAAFGRRSAKAGLASGAGKVALLATQTWWIALLAGVGSGWLANKGRTKREQLDALESSLRQLKRRPTLRYEATLPAR